MIFETARLCLHHFSREDAPFVLHILNTPSWLRYIGDRGVRTVADAEAYIESRFLPQYANGTLHYYLIRLKNDGTPVGMCGLVQRADLDAPDVGYALLPEFEGHGYAFEAAEAVMQHAKNTLNLPRVVAITNTDHVKSQQLLIKLGFRYEKTLQIPNDDVELMLFAYEKS